MREATVVQKDVKAQPEKLSDDRKDGLTCARRVEKPTGPTQEAKKIGGT